MNNILKTKEYNKFKFDSSNRPINNNNLNMLIESISNKNLLSLRPIQVKSDMTVIDGQHRLLAAKHLQIPIHYQVEDALEISDIVLLQNQTKWTLENFHNYWLKQGNPEYRKLDEFMKKNNIALALAIRITSPKVADGPGRKEGARRHFKEGRYKFPDSVDEVNDKIKFVKSIIEMICHYKPSLRKHYQQVTFFHALVEFVNLRSVDKDVFIRKLEYGLDELHICRNREAYYTMFKDIYNYKNKNKINDEIEEN